MALPSIKVAIAPSMLVRALNWNSPALSWPLLRLRRA
jgi:hypothetical protein